MPDLRSYCRPPEVEPAEIRLDREESHHLVAVNRAREGDTVVAFDGLGREWVCECVAADKREAVLKVRFAQKARPLPYRITLAQAVPKGRYMDAIIRKATEIGAAAIVPLLSERTVVRVDDEEAGKKKEKWVTATIEAAKQCGNPWLPEIAEPVSVETFVERQSGNYDLKLIASLQPGAQSLREVLTRFRNEQKREPANVAWMIGPEGDFTTAEMAAARNHGFEPISLGPLVLRCETAAVCALSVLSYELQNATA
ncbi:MAG: 16S rRNA (uracil(1498)-N(3))-methyltransferase [Verrucomicrobia bacterium]|nr:MAG: 16S rRNA (uracil(1498)-N(3))-methyltransferase [Verrucomicrobiota bacterium]